MEKKTLEIEGIEDIINYADSCGYEEMYLYLTEDRREVKVVILNKEDQSLQLASEKFFKTEEEMHDAEDMVVDMINSGERCERLCYITPELLSQPQPQIAILA